MSFNPTCSGGGHIVPALQKTCSCSSLFGLRDPKFWYNSCIIVTLDVLNLWNQKCVSKKNWSMFFDAGVKNQKFKNGKMTPKTILYHAHTKNKKLLFSWPCLFRPLFIYYLKFDLTRKIVQNIEIIITLDFITCCICRIGVCYCNKYINWLWVRRIPSIVHKFIIY